MTLTLRLLNFQVPGCPSRTEKDLRQQLDTRRLELVSRRSDWPQLVKGAGLQQGASVQPRWRLSHVTKTGLWFEADGCLGPLRVLGITSVQHDLFQSPGWWGRGSSSPGSLGQGLSRLCNWEH